MKLISALSLHLKVLLLMCKIKCSGSLQFSMNKSTVNVSINACNTGILHSNALSKSTHPLHCTNISRCVLAIIGLLSQLRINKQSLPAIAIQWGFLPHNHFCCCFISSPVTVGKVLREFVPSCWLIRPIFCQCLLRTVILVTFSNHSMGDLIPCPHTLKACFSPGRERSLNYSKKIWLFWTGVPLAVNVIIEIVRGHVAELVAVAVGGVLDLNESVFIHTSPPFLPPLKTQQNQKDNQNEAQRSYYTTNDGHWKYWKNSPWKIILYFPRFLFNIILFSVGLLP